MNTQRKGKKYDRSCKFCGSENTEFIMLINQWYGLDEMYFLEGDLWLCLDCGRTTKRSKM